jgi:hypothetical protein
MHQWLDFFGPVKGDVECTSLVTRLATKLDLMENYLVQKIPGGRTYLAFEYFRQVQLLKKKDGVVYMMYHGMSTEIPLPNLGLGIYAMQSFLVGLKPIPQTLRSSSTRLVNMPRAHYYGADTTPEGPAYTSYADWGQAESSRHAQEVHNPWEQPQPQYSDGSWQASSEQWRRRTNPY